jgi:hypothetical protein
VRNEGGVAPDNTQSCAPGLVDEVVRHLHAVGLVLEPGGRHVLKARALANPQTRLATVVYCMHTVGGVV